VDLGERGVTAHFSRASVVAVAPLASITVMRTKPSPSGRQVAWRRCGACPMRDPAARKRDGSALKVRFCAGYPLRFEPVTHSSYTTSGDTTARDIQTGSYAMDGPEGERAGAGF